MEEFLKQYNKNNKINKKVLEMLFESIDNLDYYVDIFLQNYNNEDVLEFQNFLKNQKCKKESKNISCQINKNNIFNYKFFKRGIINVDIEENIKKPKLNLFTLDNVENKSDFNQTELPGLYNEVQNEDEWFDIIKNNKTNEVFQAELAIMNRSIEDIDEINYSIPERLFFIWQCNKCGIRFQEESTLIMHIEEHDRSEKAEKMEGILRRGWFNFKHKDKMDIYLKTLLENSLKFIRNTKDTEKYFLETYVDNIICIKCKERIFIQYDNKCNMWFIVLGVKINFAENNIKYAHKKCIM